jgi:hypothetical protein
MFTTIGLPLSIRLLLLLVRHHNPLIYAPPALFAVVELARSGTSAQTFHICDYLRRWSESLADGACEAMNGFVGVLEEGFDIRRLR